MEEKKLECVLNKLKLRQNPSEFAELFQFGLVHTKNKTRKKWNLLHLIHSMTFIQLALSITPCRCCCCSSDEMLQSIELNVPLYIIQYYIDIVWTRKKVAVCAFRSSFSMRMNSARFCFSSLLLFPSYYDYYLDGEWFYCLLQCQWLGFIGWFLNGKQCT